MSDINYEAYPAYATYGSWEDLAAAQKKEIERLRLTINGYRNDVIQEVNANEVTMTTLFKRDAEIKLLREQLGLGETGAKALADAKEEIERLRGEVFDAHEEIDRLHKVGTNAREKNAFENERLRADRAEIYARYQLERGELLTEIARLRGLLWEIADAACLSNYADQLRQTED